MYVCMGNGLAFDSLSLSLKSALFLSPILEPDTEQQGLEEAMEGLEEEPSRAAADVLRLIPVQCGVCVCVWVLEAARVFSPSTDCSLSLSLEWTVQERERDQKPTNLVASRAN
jgi:hypothetical protein